MADFLKSRSKWGRFAVLYVVLIAFGATMLVPLAWMFQTSLQPATADVMNITKVLPDEYRFDNYTQVVNETNFARAIGNSAFVTVATTAGLVLTSSLAAFAFARMRFFARDQIFFGYLATLMIPSSVTMIPVFILLRALGWVDTYWALIFPPMFSAYGVFMLRQFFLAIPRELEEAAIIDGCSTFGVYWRVVMPLAKPALAALTILTFMGSWRSFMWPVIVTHSKEMATLPVALMQFTEMFSVKWNLLMAGSVIMILPMVLVFLFGQRFFIAGIQLGAVKG